MSDLLGNLKKRNITESSLKLYMNNLKRLNDGKEIKNYTFLKNPEKILEKLGDKSENTKRAYIISIVSLLKLEPKQKKLYDKYFSIMKEMNDKGKVNVTKSESQKENWMSQDQINEIYQGMENEIRPKAEKKDIKTEADYEKLLNYAILSLYILQSPRRNADYQKMLIVKKYIPGLDKNYNYLDITNKQFIFENYKTAGTYKTKIEDIPSKLWDVIKLYLDVHPQAKQIKTKKAPEGLIYFLVHHDGSYLKSVNAMTKILNKIFGKKIGVSMLRNIYGSSKYSDVIKELKEDASNMGTSVDVLINNYIKQD